MLYASRFGRGFMINRRILTKILIVAFALVIGTQVLFGQVIFDLNMCSGCCGGMAHPTSPVKSQTHHDCDCSLVAAPLSTSIVFESSVGSLNVFTGLLPAVKLQTSSFQAFRDDTADSWNASPPFFNTPEKLSIFRI